MKRWLVVTPQYNEVIPVLDTGEGPTETVADVIEIEAETPRDAIALGVREMLRLAGRWRKDQPRFKLCADQRSDRLCPYTGVKAYPVGEE